MPIHTTYHIISYFIININLYLQHSFNNKAMTFHQQGKLQSRILTNIISIVKHNTIKDHHLMFLQKQAEDMLVKQYKNMIPAFKILIVSKEMYDMYHKGNHQCYLSQMFCSERNKMRETGYALWLKGIIDRINVYEEYFSCIQRFNKFLQHEGKSAYSYSDNAKYNIFEKGTTQFLVQLMNSQYDVLQSKNCIFQLLSWTEINIELSPADPLSVNIKKILLLILNLVKQIKQLRRNKTQSSKKEDLSHQFNMMQQENHRLKYDLKKKFMQNKDLQKLLTQRNTTELEQLSQIIKNKQQVQAKLEQFIVKLSTINKQIIEIKQQHKIVQQSHYNSHQNQLLQKNQMIQSLNIKIEKLQQFISKKEQQNNGLSSYLKKLTDQKNNHNIQINNYDNKFLQLEQNQVKLKLQLKDVKNRYQELMIKSREIFDKKERQNKEDESQGKNYRSRMELLECNVEQLKVQNSLFAFQLSEMKEHKERFDEQLNNQILLTDDLNKLHLAQIQQLKNNYNFKIKEELSNLQNSLEKSSKQKTYILEQGFRRQFQTLQIKLMEAEQQRQQFKQKYYKEMSKVLKKSMVINQSRHMERPIERQTNRSSFNLINVLDNTIIEVFQPQNNIYNKAQELKDVQYSNIVYPQEWSNDEEDSSSIIKDFQNSIRNKMSGSHQKMSQQNEVLKAQINNLQAKVKGLQQLNFTLKQRMQQVQSRDKQYSLAIKQKQCQITYNTSKISKLMKTNQDYERQLNNYLQNKISINNYSRPQLIHIKELLFNGDVFRDSYPQFKSRLIKHVQSYVNTRIVRTQLLYKYDVYNKTNFHLYIDQKEYFMCLVKTPNTIIAGFYPGKIQEKKLLTEGGILISVTKDQSFALKRNRHNDKALYKGMVYDKYYIIFGNAQLRIKSGQKKIFSNFGIGSGFYDYQKAEDRRVGYFLQNGDDKQCNFEYCECYQLFFDGSIDLKSGEDHSLFKTF